MADELDSLDIGSLFVPASEGALLQGHDESLKTPPAAAAKFLSLQARTGLPSEFIAQDPQTIESDASRSDFNADLYRANNPRFAKWLEKNPHHYALVAKDLSFFEKLGQMDDAARSTWKSVPRMEERAQLNLNEMSRVLNGDDIRITTEESKRLAELDKEDELDQQLQDAEAIPAFVARSVTYATRQLGSTVGSMAKGAAVGGVLGAPVGMAVPAASGGAFVASAKYTYDLEAGLAFDKLKRVKDIYGEPIDPKVAARSAQLVGVLNAIIELGSEAAVATVIGLPEAIGLQASKAGVTKMAQKALASPTIGKMLAKALAINLETSAIETGEEAFQGGVGALGEVLAETMSGQTFDEKTFTERMAGTDKELLSVLVGQLAGPGLVFGAFGVHNAVRSARKAEEAQRFYTALAEGRDTESFKVLPGKFQEALQETLAGSPLENVYFQAKDWKERFEGLGVDPKAVAEEAMPGGGKLYQDALEGGNTFSMPTSTYAAKVVPQHGEFFNERIRYEAGPNAMSALEAKEANKAALEKLGEVRLTDSEEDFKADYKDQLVKKFREAGRSATESEGLAELKARVVIQSARLREVTPQELLASTGERFEVVGPAQRERQAQREAEREKIRQATPSREDVAALFAQPPAQSPTAQALGTEPTPGTGEPSQAVPLAQSLTGIWEKVKGMSKLTADKASFLAEERAMQGNELLSDAELEGKVVAASVGKLAMYAADVPGMVGTMKPAQAKFILDSMLRDVVRLRSVDPAYQISPDVVSAIGLLQDRIFAKEEPLYQGPAPESQQKLKAEQAKQAEIEDGLIEDGINVEHEDVAKQIERWVDIGDYSALLSALKSPGYPAYIQDLKRLLTSVYPSGFIVVTRKEGYVGTGRAPGVEFLSTTTNPSWSGTRYKISVDDVVAAGSESEGELIVRSSAIPIYEETKEQTKAVRDTDSESQTRSILEWGGWVPEKTQEGKLKGVPEGVKTMAQWRKLGAVIRQLAKEGEPGRYWYEDAAREVLQFVGGDIVEAEKYIQLLAIFSPNTNVPQNANVATRVYNDYRSGVPREQIRGHMSANIKKAVAMLYDGVQWEGRKTQSFYLNLMSEIIRTQPASEVARLFIPEDLREKIDGAVTVDLWMLRAFGYGVAAASNDLGTGKYSTVENEVRRIAAELNSQLKPGEPLWMPHQVQAAVWTAIKARMEIPSVKTKTEEISAKKGWSWKKGKGDLRFKDLESKAKHQLLWREQGLKATSEETAKSVGEAKASFGDIMRLRAQTITAEAVPSDAFGYAINKAPRSVREMFTREVFSLLQDEHGRNLLAQKLGIFLEQSGVGTGLFEEAINPNIITELLVYKPQGEEHDLTKIEAYARAWQYITRQKAVPWFRVDPAGLDEKHQFFKAVSVTKDKKGKETVRTLKKFKTQAEASAHIASLGSPAEGVKYKVTGGRYAVGVVFSFSSPLDAAAEDKFSKALMQVLTNHVGYTKLSDGRIAVVNFRGEDNLPFLMDDESFREKIDAFQETAQSLGATTAEWGGFESRYGWASRSRKDAQGNAIWVADHDWTKDPQGKEVLDYETFAGRPDFQEWLSDRHQAFLDLLKTRYSEEGIKEREAEAARLASTAEPRPLPQTDPSIPTTQPQPPPQQFFQAPKPLTGFYSKLEQILEAKLQPVSTVEQVNAILRETKADERKWSGIDEFLGKDPKAKVSKSAILDFVRKNNLLASIRVHKEGGWGTITSEEFETVVETRIQQMVDEAMKSIKIDKPRIEQKTEEDERYIKELTNEELAEMGPPLKPGHSSEQTVKLLIDANGVDVADKAIPTKFSQIFIAPFYRTRWSDDLGKDVTERIPERWQIAFTGNTKLTAFRLRSQSANLPLEMAWRIVDALDRHFDDKDFDVVGALRGEQEDYDKIVDSIDEGINTYARDTKRPARKVYQVLGDYNIYPTLEDAEEKAEYIFRRDRLRKEQELSDEFDTKALRDAIRAEFGEPAEDMRYGRYTLPGGMNYGEIVFSLPPIMEDIDKDPRLVEARKAEEEAGAAVTTWEEENPAPREHQFENSSHGRTLWANAYREWRTSSEHRALQKAYRMASAIVSALREQIATEKQLLNYAHSHWEGIDNPFAHTRIKTRYIAGKRVMSVEEVQSDVSNDAKKPITFEEWYRRRHGHTTGSSSLWPRRKDFDSVEDYQAAQRKIRKTIDDEEKRYGEILLRKNPKEMEEAGIERRGFWTEEQAREHAKKKARLEELAVLETGLDDEIATTGFRDAMSSLGLSEGLHGDLTGPAPESLKDEWDNLSRSEKIIAIAKMAPQLQALLDERSKLHKESVAVEQSIVLHGNEGVPELPFRGAYHEFVLKALIKLAIQQGYDGLLTMPGAVESEFYSLAKQVDALAYSPTSKNFTAYKDGKKVVDRSEVGVTQLMELVGTDVARKLVDTHVEPLTAAEESELQKLTARLASEEEMTDRARYKTEARVEHLLDRKNDNRRLVGVDMKVNPEGKNTFYDEIIPRALNKLGKAWGAKVEDVYLPKEASGTKAEIADNEEKGSENIVAVLRGEKPIFGFMFTPEMVKALSVAPLPLFQPQRAPEGGYRGQTLVKAWGTVLEFFGSADPSTGIHELGHTFMEQMRRDFNFVVAIPEANRTDMQKRFLNDAAAILKWLGVNSFAEIQTVHHEQFARGWEAYLYKGEAPSLELRRIFTRFKAWLIAIYRSIKNLDVEVTPEVQGIFDRMIASEEEIAAAQAEMGQTPLFAGPSGMAAEKFAKYMGAVTEAREKAKEALLTKLMSDMAREEQSWWKEQREAMRKEVLEQVNGSHPYITFYALARQTAPDGSPFPEGKAPIKLNRDLTAAQYGEERTAAMPQEVFGKDPSAHPDVMAPVLGYQSGSELVDDLKGLEDRDKLVERLTDERMLETFGDLLHDGRIHDEAVEALHTDKRSQLLRMELEHLASDDFAAFKGLVKKVTRKLPTVQLVRDWAVGVIASTKVREIKPSVYLRAEGFYAREAVDALVRGDIDAAVEAKDMELRNHELYRAAMSAKDRLDKADKLYKKLFRKDEDLAKTRDMDLVGMARAIVSQVGVGKSQKTVAQYLDQIQRLDPELYDAVKDMAGQISAGLTDFKEMTFDQFSAMQDTVAALWELSKRSKQILIDGQLMARDEAVDQLIERMTEIAEKGELGAYTRSATDWEKAQIKLMGLRSALMRVESWVDAMGGRFRDFFFTPISEATAKYRLERKRVLEQYLEIVKKLEGRLEKKDIVSPELNHIFSGKQELLHAMLHTGNDSNLSKLLRGYGWGTEDENGVLDTARWDAFVLRMQDEGILTKEDYDFLQDVWNLLETLKDPAQKAHKEMYGYYFGEVTSKPIVNRFGKYKGGYIPAFVDPYKASDAAIREEKDALEKADNSFMFPTTGRGFTKKRVEAYARPLALDLRYIPMHIDKVMRFTIIEPRVKDVSRILFSQKFRRALEQIDPTVAGDMLVPWLQRAASQKVEGVSKGWAGKGFDQFWKTVRSRTGLQIMFGNVSNTLQQFTGLSITAVKVDLKYLRSALWTYTRGPGKVTEMVNEKSEFMRTRTTAGVIEVQNELDDLLLDPTKYEKARAFAQKHGYFLQAATQNIVDIVSWTAAYDEATASGKTEKEAVRYADSVVRQTQGSFSAEDISRFETGTPFVRAFTMFYSYFNMMANLQVSEFTKISRELGVQKGAGRMFYTYLFGFAIPAVLSEAIVTAAKGKLDDDDDDSYLDDIMSILFGSQLRTATAMFPIVGPVVGAGVNAWNDKWYDDRISTSPVVSSIESAVQAPHTVYKAMSGKSKASKAIRDSLTLVGLMTGLPVAPLGRPLGYLADVAQGAANPSGPIDFTRGLVTGKK